MTGSVVYVEQHEIDRDPLSFRPCRSPRLRARVDTSCRYSVTSAVLFGGAAWTGGIRTAYCWPFLRWQPRSFCHSATCTRLPRAAKQELFSRGCAQMGRSSTAPNLAVTMNTFAHYARQWVPLAPSLFRHRLRFRPSTSPAPGLWPSIGPSLHPVNARAHFKRARRLRP